MMAPLTMLSALLGLVVIVTTLLLSFAYALEAEDPRVRSLLDKVTAGILDPDTVNDDSQPKLFRELAKKLQGMAPALRETYRKWLTSPELTMPPGMGEDSVGDGFAKVEERVRNRAGIRNSKPLIDGSQGFGSIFDDSLAMEEAAEGEEGEGEEEGIALYTSASEHIARLDEHFLALKVPPPPRDASNTLVLAAATTGVSPLSLTPADFIALYKNHFSLWSDLTPAEAHGNFVRASIGSMDSASLLLEFGLLPALHAAVRDPSVESKPIRTLMNTDGPSVKSSRGRGAPPSSTALIAAATRISRRTDGLNALHIAAAANNVVAITAIISTMGDNANSDFGLNAPALSGMTPLMVAAALGHVEAATALLDGDCAIDARHRYAASTALHFAAEMGRGAVISLLCARGADVNAVKKYGGTALHIAADSNSSEAIDALLSAPCNADATRLLMGDTTPLYLAASKGHVKALLALLRSPAALKTINFSMPTVAPSVASALGPAPSMLSSELHSASAEGESSFRRLAALHLPGSNPWQSGFEAGNGATALHAAVENGHFSVVRVLLDAGAKQLGSMQGLFPLHTAVQYGHADMLPLLARNAYSMTQGVDVTMPDGSTPLHQAVLFAHQDKMNMTVKLLLQWGADPMRKDRRNKTPLDVARQIISDFDGGVSAGSVRKAIKELKASANRPPIIAATEAGLVIAISGLCDIAKKNGVLVTGDDGTAGGPEGRLTPLHVAKSAEAVVALLEICGRSFRTPFFNVSSRAPPGRVTPLYVAAAEGRLDVMRMLVAAGAKLDARHTSGSSPLHAAAKANHADVVVFLLDLGANLSLKDEYGLTAVDVAVFAGHLDVFSKLMEYARARELIDEACVAERYSRYGEYYRTPNEKLRDLLKQYCEHG